MKTPGILEHPVAWSPTKGSTTGTFIGLHKYPAVNRLADLQGAGGLAYAASAVGPAAIMLVGLLW